MSSPVSTALHAFIIRAVICKPDQSLKGEGHASAARPEAMTDLQSRRGKGHVHQTQPSPQ